MIIRHPEWNVKITCHIPHRILLITTDFLLYCIGVSISRISNFSGWILCLQAKTICGQVKWINSTTNDNAEKDSAGDQKDSFGIVPGVVVSTKLPGNHPDWKLDEEDLNVRSTLLTRKIHQFKESVSKSRGFYANLADTLCADDSFAEKRESAPCWNGQKVAE